LITPNPYHAIDAEKQKLLKAARIELFKRQGQSAYDIQAEYGRWLIASMLAANLGGIVAILQSDKYAELLMANIGHYLVIGVFLSILTGCLTWINYTYISTYYIKLQLRDEFGADITISKWTKFLVPLSFYAPIACFTFSLGLLTWCTWMALNAISELATPKPAIPYLSELLGVLKQVAPF